MENETGQFKRPLQPFSLGVDNNATAC